jgi:carboxylesterase type B
MESAQATIAQAGPVSAESWKKLVVLANCSNTNELECIRALPATRLKDIAEHSALRFFPIHDGGVTWADNPRRDRIHSTKFHSQIARVPVLIGTNADEATVFVFGVPDTKKYLEAALPPGTRAGFINEILAAYGDNYPSTPYINGQLSKIYTDFVYQCPVGLVATESQMADIPTWRYYYNASFPNTQLFPGSGVSHSAEIGPVFATYDRAGSTPFQGELSRFMQKTWADFAKNPTQGPGWRTVPQVAVLGGGARPGQVDSDRRTVSTTDASLLDLRCGLFRAIFDLTAPP